MNDPAPTANEDISLTLGLTGTPSHRRRRWIWILLLLLLGGGAWLYARQAKPAQVRYVTETVRRGDLVAVVSATGTLQPVKEVEVGIEVSGTIKTVEVDYNDRVKVGQVMARLDVSKLEAQTRQSEATLDAARARVEQAQASVHEADAQLARLNRVRELSGGKMPAPSDLDAAAATLARARADETSARASVAQAQATLEVMRTDLSKAVILSPINGIVLKREVEPGQTVAASFQAPVLFTLAEDLTQMELQVDVDEADVGRVREGQDATFTVDAYPDRSFPARITQVRFGSQTVEGVVTYKTVLKVDNSGLELRPGMTATAVITVNRKEKVLRVSNAMLRFAPPAEKKAKSGGLVGALLPRPPGGGMAKPAEGEDIRNDRQKVWILKAGAPAPVMITKGESDGTWTEVVDGGLEEGMDVITEAVSGTP